MTRACCTSCRLRFSASEGRLATCPFCAQPLVSLSAEAALGLKLLGHEDRRTDEGLEALAAAVAAASAESGPFG